ncbi:MAG: PcfB family protein [Clostridia bacterium]
MAVQEEINHKNIALVTSGSKLTGRSVLKLVRLYLTHCKTAKESIPHGKQSVKSLAKQGQGMTSLDLQDGDLKKFDRIMKKYGVDYAIMTDKMSKIPTHTLFFKAKDNDAITKAFLDFSAQMVKKQEKPSVLSELRRMIELVKNTINNKVKNKENVR